VRDDAPDQQVDGPPRDVETTESDPQPQSRPVFLRILGHVELSLEEDGLVRELGSVLTPKQREVLVFLALHPHGVRREALNDAVWPDSRPPRQFNSLHNALSLLRRALGDATAGVMSDLVLNDDGRYHLNNDLVTTDFSRLDAVLHGPRPAGDVDDDPLPLLAAIEEYRGDLAEDLTSSWIEPYRESTRRDVLDALGALIRALSERDAEARLALLERCRRLDRFNESIYRDIIRTQAQLSQFDAIPRTLALLATTLDEIDQHTSSDTTNLADFLHRRAVSLRPAAPGNAAAS
jgi:DNA-binding SARP family transcriptional activator